MSLIYSRMVRLLPIVVGLAPVLGVIIAYRLNVDAAILPSCLPVLDGCTSISSTGRQMPGSLVFKGVMFPQAAMLALLWWFAARWVRYDRPRSFLSTWILVCGLIGSISLTIYVIFLGTEAPFYEFMRRFGIYFYFLGTAIAQLLLSVAIRQTRLRTLLLTIVAIPFALGLVNLVQKEIATNADQIENAIEWTAASCMQLWFVLLIFAWRNARLQSDIKSIQN